MSKLKCNPLKTSDILDCVYGFRIILRVNSDYFLKQTQFILAMETRCVLFEVKTEFFIII
jgi:hypothetical protein